MFKGPDLLRNINRHLGAKKEKIMLTFFQHRSSGSNPHFWVTASLGSSTVARTETYTSIAACDNAVAAAKQQRLSYETFQAADGVRFRAKGRNGEIVFQSTDAYTTTAGASSVAKQMNNGAPGARYLTASAA